MQIKCTFLIFIFFARIAIIYSDESVYSDFPFKSQYEYEWTDLPVTDYSHIMGYSSDRVKCLGSMIDNYQRIPKDDKKLLSQRIAKLKLVDEFLESWKLESNSNSEINLLNLIRRHVQSRNNYLCFLLWLTENSKIAEEQLDNWHLGLSKTNKNIYTPLILRNDITYSVKMKEFWGGFWSETIDPCHRRLGNYYQLWMTSNADKQSIASFFMWLDAQSVPKSCPVVRYLDSVEQKKYLISVKNELLYYGIDEAIPLTTTNEQLNLFIIDLDKNLYIAKAGQGIWHTSFTCGKPVFAAGQMKVKDGVIVGIAFDSGHYLPSPSLFYQAIEILKEMKVTFSNELTIIYYIDRNKYSIAIASSALQSENYFLKAIFDKDLRTVMSTCNF